MMELYLDEYAQRNALRDVDTRLKILLGLGAMLIGISSSTPWAPLFIACSMMFITCTLAKIPTRLYSSLLLIPLSFSLFSVIVILVVTGNGSQLFAVSVAGISFTITNEGANLAVLVLSRTFGGMCALYFIALTTPMIEIFSLMHSLRIPTIVVDLSMLIYHFIFVLIGEAIAIHNAQTIRHGYASSKNSIQSLAILGGMLFIRSWRQGEELLMAMDARCYDGKLEVPGEDKPVKLFPLISIILYLTICTVIAMLSPLLQIF